MQRTPISTRRLSEEETQLANVLRRTGARTSCGVMPRTTTPSTATRRSSSCTCRNRDASQPGRDASTDQWGGDQAQRALTRPLSFAAPPGWRSTNFGMEYLFGFSIAPMPATSAITTAWTPLSQRKPFSRAARKKQNTKGLRFPREAEEDWQGETARAYTATRGNGHLRGPRGYFWAEYAVRCPESSAHCGACRVCTPGI